LVLEKVVVVPELDDQLLSKAKDATRSDRLQVEKEPLAHLLAEAIDVGPSVAAALGIPERMVPVAELREDIDEWRHRWLWYEGELTQLLGPRAGHPIKGYSIYEATVRLADGESVLAAFSVPPEGDPRTGDVRVGDWVRVEGYLLKLRDTTYPDKLESVPFLVGRTMQRDYEDWPKVTELDPSYFEGMDDSTLWPGDLSMRDVEEDQTEALWHLGAFVRDTADQWDLKRWRQVEPLSVGEPYDRLVNEGLQRGEPMRVFGTLIRRRTIAAPANPANIRFWTTAWVQVSGFGGHLVPIWVPGRVDKLPMRAQLEVRGFYYRWYVYDSQKGKRYRVPLFVAADLDLFELNTGESMQRIGAWIGGAALLLVISLLVSQRRAAKSALEHSRDMDARRRKRRLAAAASAAGSAADADADAGDGPERDPD
ncbi:MAG: hypothetical protein KAI24_04055, partial [Planctomycetes bacterium]|nr:hypothetical protein [Planctomycetota bacterium]